MSERTVTDDRELCVRDRRMAIVGFHSCVIRAMAQMRKHGVGASVVRIRDGELIAHQPRHVKGWGRA